ncbi:hypothetical protein DdX_05977 [Ditylenchus destructor]|uniref:Uncharacterized protein n=1 Tax=Ditylenchus destructor TaxID=166010 RepID=A0AAD4N8F4_9BILA|nr:hypothetical protein DdX_05977 [Ditylenchus destructor]
MGAKLPNEVLNDVFLCMDPASCRQFVFLSKGTFPLIANCIKRFPEKSRKNGLSNAANFINLMLFFLSGIVIPIVGLIWIMQAFALFLIALFFCLGGLIVVTFGLLMVIFSYILLIMSAIPTLLIGFYIDYLDKTT